MTATHPLQADRRQRRWVQVHNRLYDAATALFIESGFTATSIDAIADRADVARKTVFNHYPRKKDFIAEWGNRRRAQVAGVLSADLLAHEDVGLALRHYFDSLAEVSRNDRAVTIRMMEGWRESGGPFDNEPRTLVTVLSDFVSTAKQTGAVAPQIDSDRVGTIVYSAYIGLLFDWCDGGTDRTPPFDLADAFRRMLEMMLHGLLGS